MGFADTKIVVIGGGLGGMAFMNAALFAGLTDVHLYEQAPEFTEVGAGVDITRNACRILDSYGLKEKMLWKSNSDPPHFMEYRDWKTAEYLGQIDEWGEPASRQLHRADLLDVLKDRIPADRLHLSKKLSAIEPQEHGPAYRVIFEDGTVAVADIIVGCDGIRSQVRKHLGLDDELVYSGQVVYRTYIDYKDLPPATAEMLRRVVIFRGKHKHILTLPNGNEASGSARICVVAFMPEPLAQWTAQQWVIRDEIDHFAAHITDWTSEAQDIISALKAASPDGKMLKQALYVRKPVDTWFKVSPTRPDSGIVLVGDSVHSTLPHQAQGTCMAIESGAALATILRTWKDNDLQSALKFYQTLRKPRTDKITTTSYDAGKLGSADDVAKVTPTFNPTVIRDRMKWVMEYNLLQDLISRGKDYLDISPSTEHGARLISAAEA
ncbi:uncharacterized protein Z520_05194 [Fonsecaea multimorphosa CBS 102226]|uniref:FAD-binding domain-containing protein n=1 Tax=Fonsecaea multimorphosa CBS 102226 TaxID=1442371 RepID=A0A0D2KPS0_9EURO|nr:uncharacterized protein Z520_05194 [Fonsecaea multimorphosa CBS 102226]KIX98733.1 hypothetical protein Z520_05194 [Fonsecaea multimorphosa CBS 102226]OAL32929.1 hypothetical protein AYO22_00014 [Fonsecaea multimorphosa]